MVVGTEGESLVVELEGSIQIRNSADSMESVFERISHAMHELISAWVVICS
jgi:hypothetical protein